MEIKQTITAVDGTKYEVSRRGIVMSSDRSLCGCSKGEWRKLLVRAWRAAGEYWHKVILPKHFEMGAVSEYGYQPRSTRTSQRKDRPGSYRLSYVAAKRKYKGHQLPLVWDGDLRRDVQRIRDIRADAKGAKIALHGPRYLWAYRKDLNQPDKAAELAAISEADADALAGVMDRFIAHQAYLRAQAPMGLGHAGGDAAAVFRGHGADLDAVAGG